MKTKTNTLALGIYTIFFGLFGLNDFYLGKHKKGIARIIVFAVPAIYYLFIESSFRLSLMHMELIDNVYVPAMSEGHNALLVITNTIMNVLLVFSFLWALLEIIAFFTRRSYAKEQTVSKRRFILTTILLGWSGLHDFLADRSKYAILHIVLFAISLIAIIVGRIDFSISSAKFDAYIFTIFATGIAIAIVNEIIAIIEATNFILASKKV